MSPEMAALVIDVLTLIAVPYPPLTETLSDPAAIDRGGGRANPTPSASAPGWIRTNDLRIRRGSPCGRATPVPTSNVLQTDVFPSDTTGHSKPRVDPICSHLVPTPCSHLR